MIVFEPALSPATLNRHPVIRVGRSGGTLADRSHLGELLDPRDVATDFGPGATDPNDRAASPATFGMPPYTP